MRKDLLIFAIIFLVLISSGCTSLLEPSFKFSQLEPSFKVICPTGENVSDPSMCPEVTTATTTPSTTTPAPTTFAPTTTTAGTPTVDVAGQDISDIPRYTGSVMIFYGEDVIGTIPGTIVVAYLTSASIDTVLDFYQTQLPANGWTVFDMGEVSKMPAAIKGGRGSVVVTITASEDYSGYTDINIVFAPE